MFSGIPCDSRGCGRSSSAPCGPSPAENRNQPGPASTQSLPEELEHNNYSGEESRFTAQLPLKEGGMGMRLRFFFTSWFYSLF